MKIIVSHSGKQYVNALLVGLLKYNLLEKFYTSLATNKIKAPQYFKQILKKKLQKRYFTSVDSAKIVHFPFIFLLSRILKSEYQTVRYAEKWYDTWVANRLRKEDFDILIGYENCNLASFKTAKMQGKITVLDMAAVHHQFQNPILTAAGTYHSTYKIDYICSKKEAAYQYTDYVFALSTFAEKTMIDGGFSAERIYKTYLGINQAVFVPKKYKNTVERSEIPHTCGEGPSQEKNEVLNLYFVGTMSLRKGLPFLILLLKKLIERGRNIQLTLIGPIDDFDASVLREPHCRYVPFLTHNDLVNMHHDLDLFVFPSHIDSWAQVVIEAMACGSPVLVSENTGAKDAVAQGGGMILPVGDMAAWVAAIESFYFDRHLLKTVGTQAAIVAKNYTWEAYHAQVYAALTDIYAKENNGIEAKKVKNYAKY
jgi:glycosyltransferase involved in cell wall biosynthesis